MSSSLCLHQLLQRHFKLCGRKCLWSNYDVTAAFTSRYRGKLRKESIPPRYELGTCRIQFCSVNVAQSCSVGSTDYKFTPSVIVYTSPGRGVDHPPPSSAEVKTSSPISLLPLWFFATCCRLNSTVSAVCDCAIGIFLFLVF